MLRFRRQNPFLFRHRQCMFTLPLLCRQHHDQVLIFPYWSKSVFVPRSLYRRGMLWHLSDHSSLKSNNYNIASYDYYASHIPHATSTYGQRERNAEEFPLLFFWRIFEILSSRSLIRPCTCAVPGWLTVISPLTQRQERENGDLPFEL